MKWLLSSARSSHPLVRARWLLGIASIGSALGLTAIACGQSQTSAQPATGSERGACFPNNTCLAGLTCLSDLCVNDPARSDTTDGSVDAGPTPDAGPPGPGTDANCGTIPTFTSACFAQGHNACPDGTCVDYVEAGCPPIVDFTGGWPLRCGADVDCLEGGTCCAGASGNGEPMVSASNRCMVDNTPGVSFYSRATHCDTNGTCQANVCRSDLDCFGGRHCAIMYLTNDPKGPGVGACVK